MIKTLPNGVKMPQLGIGTFRISESLEAYETVKYALEVGYRHIDTAQIYNNEEMVGQAIKDSGIPREEIFITTKYWGFSHEANMEKAFNESLKKLQTDYIDLYLIHWPNHDEEITARTWAYLEKLYEQKRVRAIGVSNFQKHHMESLLKTAKIVPMMNQVECHPGLSQVPLKAYLDSKHIMMTSYGPLMKGGIFKPPFFDTLDVIAHRHNVSIANIVIAWGLQRGIFMIPKSVTPSRILENFQSQYVKLSNEEMEAINHLNRGNRVYADPDNTPWGSYRE